MKKNFKAIGQASLCGTALVACIYGAQAGTTDLASAPLETSSPTLVKPNMLFVLDDSASMAWDYLPDWVKGMDDPLFNNSRVNGVYYDPTTTYTPPVNYDGSSYPTMDSATTSAWTKVPNDKYGIQSTATSNLTTSANYYTFTPGEYCTGVDLRSCATQSAPSTSNPYPAYIRWCSNSNLTDCQATRIDVQLNKKTYTSARYPGKDAKGAVAKLTVSGTGTSSITSIMVNGDEILPAAIAVASNATTATIANAIRDNINACTVVRSGNCSRAGYSATSSQSDVSITGPAFLGATLNTKTPVVTKPKDSRSITATAFSNGATASVPGANTQVFIVSTTTNYPKDASRTDCADSTCTYAEEMTNYANWWAYYHTRMQMTKTAASLAFKDVSTSTRLGYMSIVKASNSPSSGSADFLDVADVTTEKGGQKDLWYAKLKDVNPYNYTTLRASLSQAGRYYAGKLKTVNGKSAKDPMQYACQRNYTLLFTDGYWNQDSDPVDIGGSTIKDVDGASGVPRPALDGTKTANTLADAAYYYYTKDIRDTAFSNTKSANGDDVANNDTLNGPQRMYTYTIGLGVSGYMQYQSDYKTATSGDYYDVLKGTTADSTHCRWQTSGACNWPVPANNSATAIDDLWHAAVNGGGTYYSAGDPSALKYGISRFLNEVNSQNSAGAAVTPSTSNVTSTDKYLFDSNFFSGLWYGELARYTIDPTTGLPGTVPDWSQSGTASTTATTTPTPLLDNRSYSTRTIYTQNAGSLISFTWDTLPKEMQNYFKVTAIGSLTQMCAAGDDCINKDQKIDSTTVGTNTGIGGINLVNFLRGDRSNEGKAGGQYYFERKHILGDIVGSQAAYVKLSNFNYPDTGYAEFKKANSTRQGMVYVGANDGMLHAFNADNGSESWAYIPSMLLPKLYKLADKDYGRNHTYFVNGSPQQGEVYFDNEWHTILVGGLAAGGRGYYALDVTTPGTPKVLWEFGADSTTGSPTWYDNDLGYTYGIPIITKLSDDTWAVIISSGYNNVSPGSGGGFLWVLNAKTGKLIKKIATGVGSDTNVVAGSGCTKAPCPSGLSRISAWMDNVNISNKVTYVYGGDLYGNVWRFDLRKLTKDGGTASAQLLATVRDGTNNAQPVTSWIELGYTNGSRIVYVGTGSYLGVTDIGSTQVQSIYAIKDPLTTTTTGGIYGSPRDSACSNDAKTNCFMKQVFTDKDGARTVASSMSFATNLGAMSGWFIDLPNTGERINTDSTLQLGMLVFVSNLPNNDNACGTGGSAYLNYLDYKTGLTIRTTNVAGTLLAGGSGLGSAPAVLSTPGGKLIASVKMSTGKRVDVPLPPGVGGTGTRRVSWRELITQ